MFTIAGYGAFLDLGFGWAGVRFTAEAHARRDRDVAAGVLWALMLYQALSGGLVLALLVAGADGIGGWLMGGAGEDAGRVAALLPVAGMWFALSSLNGIFVGVLRGLQRPITAAVVAGTALVVGAGGAVVVGRGHGVHAAALCQVLGALAASLVAVGALRTLLLPTPPGRLIASSARQLRRMLGFSLWTVLGRLVQVSVLQGDKLVAARVAGAVPHPGPPARDCRPVLPYVVPLVAA